MKIIVVKMQLVLSIFLLMDGQGLCQDAARYKGVNRAREGKISASGENLPEEGKDKCFDGSPATKWLVFAPSGWIQYRLPGGTGYTIDKYRITSANDAPGRDPREWTLSGSNDGVTYIPLDRRANQVFLDRFQTNSYSFANKQPYSFYRFDFSANQGAGELQIAEIELIDTSTPGEEDLAAMMPPQTWREHWFEHNQLLELVKYNLDVVLYFDSDMHPSAAGWIFPFMTKVWRYTKKNYGSFGTENRLYAVFHQGRFSGGHPASYLDASHDFRNVIDCGPGPWDNALGWAIDAPIHEVGHIVEGAFGGVKGSPAFPIWGDSKWCEIFTYDVYLNIGVSSDAIRVYNAYMSKSDSYPKPNTFWFRDWFYPIYHHYGGSRVLVKFFQLLALHFPKNGQSFQRDMNMGEFVHFWSGAAGISLQSMAKEAFGWTKEWAKQYQQACRDFPDLGYRVDIPGKLPAK